MSARRKIPVYSVYGDVKHGETAHSPLALGMIVAFAKKYKGGVLNDVYNFNLGPPIPEDLSRETDGAYGAGIFLCSHYMWSSDHNLKLAKIAKAWNPASITIHGGPSVPKYDYSCRSFFETHPYIDIAVRGEGELTTAELLEQFAIHALDNPRTDRRYLSNVPGITYRNGVNCGDGDVIRTDDRPRIEDLDTIPSPYLTEAFPNEDVRSWGAAIIETNRGCPYGCTFCDWGSSTMAKVRQFAIERIEGEIEWIARRQVGLLFIADANFGIFSRDIRIAEIIAACHKKYGYPKQVIATYAKSGTERIAEIVRILHSAGIMIEGVIALQTSDPQVLKVINRANIKTERYEDLIGIFRRHNLTVASDLMIGLPGSTVETFKADHQFCFDRKVHVRANPTRLLPNSPMAHRDYLEKYRIETDSEGFLVSSYSYTRSDIRTMEQFKAIYELTVGCYSILKYLLYYLQVEHHIKATSFLEALQNQLNLNPASLPETCALIDGSPSILARRGVKEWVSFYDEIARFVSNNYGIADRPVNTVLSVQAKVMPAIDRWLPEKLKMEHDFVTYFEGIKCARNLGEFIPPKRLAEYGPGTLEISDPNGLCNIDSNVLHTAYEPYQIEWELTSALRSSDGPYHHFVEPKGVSRNRPVAHLRYWILRNKSRLGILFPVLKPVGRMKWVRRMYEITP
jgi:radical SAM superfamily enzyme YgiQ (UPF0313 family)